MADVETLPEGIKLAEAAKVLGVSEKTLERYVAQRRIPAFAMPPARVGQGTRGTKPILVFDRAEVLAFREQFRIGPRLAKTARSA